MTRRIMLLLLLLLLSSEEVRISTGTNAFEGGKRRSIEDWHKRVIMLIARTEACC